MHDTRLVSYQSQRRLSRRPIRRRRIPKRKQVRRKRLSPRRQIQRRNLAQRRRQLRRRKEESSFDNANQMIHIHILFLLRWNAAFEYLIMELSPALAERQRSRGLRVVAGD